MKNKRYRCGLCDEIKKDNNIVYKCWDSNKKPENCSIIGICRKCNAKMRKFKINKVETMVKVENLIKRIEG